MSVRPRPAPRWLPVVRVAPADVESWSGKGRHDENFPVGSILIARKYRDPIHRFYTFARNADDIADSPILSATEKLARLVELLEGEHGYGLYQAVSALKESANPHVYSAANYDELVDGPVLIAFDRLSLK